MQQPAERPPQAIVAPALEQQGCAGETITRIDVHRYAPSPQSAAERAVAATTEAVGLGADRMDESVLRAYVRLRAGDTCIERDRRESERMLRGLPYVASAAVSAIPTGEGRVVLRVDVVSEVPWVLGGRLGAGGVRALRVGTLDLDGRGLSAVLSAERGGAFRTGLGLSLAQYGVFGRPAVASLRLERRRLGGLAQVGIAEPFLTNGQLTAMHFSVGSETEYAALVRPAGGDAAARTERMSYHIGWVRRVGAIQRGRPIGLAGLMLMGSEFRTGSDVFVLSDTGLLRTSDSVLVGRYPDYAVNRVAAVGGLRALRFDTVRRFDALRAAQDVGTGLQVNLLVAPSLGGAGRSRDVLVATDVYAGSGTERSFAALSMRAEARRATGAAASWDGVVASARLSWHQIVSPERTRVLSLSAASLHRLAFPAQLTLRDPDGGLIGFPDSRGAGGQRAVIRLEERRLTDWFRPRADLAVAAFIDAGRLWAGDVPYGASTGVHSSVGVSLLGSFPSGGKRIYRLDVGAPLDRERGGPALALRFSIADRTSITWAEPRDVARARAGTGPAALMRW